MKEKKPTKKRELHSNWEKNTAEMLKKWSLNIDAFAIEEFYTNLDIPKTTWDDAVARNEELFAANEYAKIRCGINREKLAIKRNESINSTNSFILPYYLTRWKEQIEWRNKLKQEQENKNNISIVELPCASCSHKDNKDT